MACRLCTANDRDALIEYLAEKTWDARVSNMPEEVPWSEAGATWQSAFREMAVGAIQALERH
jgi:hypothetical protein